MIQPSTREEKRRYSPWRRLTLQLFAFIILPLSLLLLATTIGSLLVHQNAMRMMVGERDQRAIITAALAVATEFDHRSSAIRSMALLANHSPAAALADILSANDFLAPDFPAGLAFFDADGNLQANTGDDTFWKSITPEQIRKQVEGIDSGKSSRDYQIIRDPASAETLLLFSTPTVDGNWLAAGALSVQELAQGTLEGAMPHQNQGGVMLVDGDRQVLYRSGDIATGESAEEHPGVEEALHGETGTTFLRTRNAEHVVAYAPIPGLGWAIVNEEAWEMVADPILQTSQLMPLALVPALLIALVGLWFGVRQVVQPIQKLEAEADGLARGDFKAIEEPVGGIAEIRYLQLGLVQMARKLREAQDSLHNYIGAITRGQEEERHRLARELHDDTIQSLIALKQRIQIAKLDDESISSSRSLSELEDLTEQTIADLRRLIRDLRPIYLEDLGLSTALEMLAHQTSQSGIIMIEFLSHGNERRLRAEVELALYRMAQESISNILRHSQATHAQISISFQVDEVTLEVKDNGIGFNAPTNPAEFAVKGHFGLLGLHERADLIGAHFEILTAPKNGTVIKIIYREMRGTNG